jgi:hypothetical protein
MCAIRSAHLILRDTNNFHICNEPVQKNMLKVKLAAGISYSVIATLYGLKGSAIESRWGRDFGYRPYWPWGPPSLLQNGYRVPFPGVKRPGHGDNHLPPSSAEAEERVNPYFYFPLGLHGRLHGQLYLQVKIKLSLHMPWRSIEAQEV